ncbi:hypothetical protein GJ633_05440 [Halorubrum sp. CBA1125]|nr:hypothetical protein [Halorubrum sp. CBA1125]
MKLSKGKVTYPNAKSVLRIEEDGRYTEDIIELRDKELSGEDLLRTVIEDGDRSAALPDLDTTHATAREQRQKLPEEYRRIERPETYVQLVTNSRQKRVNCEHHLKERSIANSLIHELIMPSLGPTQTRSFLF